MMRSDNASIFNSNTFSELLSLMLNLFNEYYVLIRYRKRNICKFIFTTFLELIPRSVQSNIPAATTTSSRYYTYIVKSRSNGKMKHELMVTSISS